MCGILDARATRKSVPRHVRHTKSLVVAIKRRANPVCTPSEQCALTVSVDMQCGLLLAVTGNLSLPAVLPSGPIYSLVYLHRIINCEGQGLSGALWQSKSSSERNIKLPFAKTHGASLTLILMPDKTCCWHHMPSVVRDNTLSSDGCQQGMVVTSFSLNRVGDICLLAGLARFDAVTSRTATTKFAVYASILELL